MQGVLTTASINASAVRDLISTCISRLTIRRRSLPTTDTCRIAINAPRSNNGIYNLSLCKSCFHPPARVTSSSISERRREKHELLEKYSSGRVISIYLAGTFNFRAYFLSKHDRTYSRYSPRVTKIFKGGISSVSPATKCGAVREKEKGRKKRSFKELLIAEE